MAPVDTSEAVLLDALAECADRFEARLAEHSDLLADHLMGEVPELGDEPELRAEWVASNRANLAAFMAMIRTGVPSREVQPPPDALEVARTYVLRGTPLTALLRVYRVGHAFVYERWLEVLQQRDDDRAFFQVLIQRSLQISFAYVDAMSVHIAETYLTERANAVRGADLARAETARAILAGDPVDAEHAGRTLGYDLGRWHTGLVLWADPQGDADSPIGRLEDAARELAAVLGCARPLVVPAGRSLLWAWCGTDARPAQDHVHARRPDGVSVAIGDAAEAISGFVRSHEEALEARRVHLLARRPAGAVVRYRDVDVLSLLSGDLPRARRLVETELGALAGDDDADRRLRATLRAYLEEDHSFAGAARRLGIHENTVRYRVRQCEELLGRPAGERSLKLHAALALADVIG